jgi:hypothetical protein
MKMKWNNKQKDIASTSTWPTNLIMKKDYKANRDDKMDCDDDCNGVSDCKNKRVQKCLWKKFSTLQYSSSPRDVCVQGAVGSDDTT